MNVYIVYAHPNPDSFNHALLDNLLAGIEEAGHAATVSDLYADGFNPALSADDLALAADGKVADDVKPYQEKILAADAIAFVFPIWWFGPPALLKGWFDRVFTKGFAYDMGGPMGLMPLLKVKKALVLSTAGGMEPMYLNLGFADAMSKVLVNGTLQITGIFKVKHEIFHNVVDCEPECREGFLEQARQLGKEYF